jgi:Putative phage tail protein
MNGSRQGRRQSRREKLRSFWGRLTDTTSNVSMDGVVGEGGARFFANKNPVKAKWENFRRSAPKKVDVDVYGNPIALNYGTFRHQCDIIWSTGIRPYVPDSVNVNQDEFVERYLVSFAVKVCEGEQGALLRVWFNKTLVYDYTQTNADEYAAHPNYVNKLVFYPGSETQTADPVMEAADGAGNVPAYRGTCYLVFKDIPLSRFGDEIPQVEAEVQSLASPDFTTYDTAIPTPDTADVANFAASRSSRALYQLSQGVLSIVRRRASIVSRSVDVQAVLDLLAGGNVAGNFCIDETAPGAIDPVYILCFDSLGKSFIVRYDGAFTDNFAARTDNTSFESCFVHRDKLYVADGTNSKIHCFDKITLALQWTRSGPSGAFSAGNFTVDKTGRVALVWEDTSDPDTLYLTRCTGGGTVKSYALALVDGAARGIIYDNELDIYLTGGVAGGRVCRVSNGSTPAILSSVAGKTGARCGPLFTAQFRATKGSYWCDGTNIYRLRHATLATRETIALSSYADTGTGTEAYGYSATERAFWICRDTAPALSKLPLNRFIAAGVGLDDVIEDLCVKAGLSASDVDVTALAGLTVQGFGVLDRVPAKEALEILLAAYQVGVREHFGSGYSAIKLEFVPRTDGATFSAIEEEHLGLGEGEPQEEIIQEQWTNEEEMPHRVSVRYADVRRDYDSHVQKSESPPDVTAATREFNLDFPSLVLTDDQAKQLADVVLDSAWIEGTVKVFTVPLQYLRLEPEDVEAVLYNGVTHVVRIESVELGANYLLEVSAVLCSVEGYTSPATGTPAPGASNPVVSPVGALLVLVDSPAVRDVDGVALDAGLYAFAGPSSSDSTYQGARLMRSTDGGVTFATLATTGSAAGAGIGVTTEALADGDVFTFQSADTVTFQKLSGTFSTATEAALYLDKLTNLVAIGSEAGGWELVQYKTATDLGGGVWQLTGMIRGRFGTESYTATHAAGEMVCLFDFSTPTTARVILPLSDRNQDRLYKAVSIGASPEATAARSFTNTCRSLMPYSVIRVTGQRNTPAANDWTINWTRRTRIGAELIDEFDAAVNEEQEKYEIDIRDSPTGAVQRTLTVGPGLPALSGVNLSATAGTQTVTRASGSWLTDGFLVGQEIDTLGFSSAANNRRRRISALTATDMTLTGSAALVTEASGSGKSVTAVTPAVVYTAAQQVTDGGSKPSFYANIYQISGRLRSNDGTGRGFGVQTFITE